MLIILTIEIGVGTETKAWFSWVSRMWFSPKINNKEILTMNNTMIKKVVKFENDLFLIK